MTMPETTNVKVEAPSDNTEVRIMLARFETKLDLVIGQHGEQLKDHETRIRTVEERKTVSPMQLLATSATAVALFGGVVTFLDRLYA
jgi:hypothetical protein